MSDVEDIKNRLDIVDVVREYVQLKQAGTNWKACCPFHNEKTPSFMVSKDKQIWHCFGCNEGGDIFSFIQKIEGVDFPEALRILADKAGVKLSNYNPEVSNQKTKLMDVCESAANFFHQYLLKSEAGEIARDYLEKRGVGSMEIEQFKLGYAPDTWDALLNALKKKGFGEQDIFLAGLTAKKERGTGFYDRFRERLMFPIWDVHSNVIGFTGRILGLEKEGVGKYVNTPQTQVYDKSRVIYGLNFAKQEIRKNDLAVIVEGNMDVVASHGVNANNVVATSGTAMTIEQIKLLKRYSENLALAFDSDPAGESAADRGIDLALAEGMNIRIIVLPKGFKDPDELIKSGSDGVDKWKEAIKNSQSIMEYFFAKVLNKYDREKVEDKKKIAEILLSKITKISNQVEQTHWIQKLAELLRVKEEILRSSLPKKDAGRSYSKGEAVKGLKIEEKSFKTASNEDILGEEILSLALKNSGFLPKIIEKILPEMFSNPQLVDIYKNLVSYYNKYTDIDLDDFKNNLANENLSNYVDQLSLLADKEFSELDKDKQGDELSKLICRLRINYWTGRVNILVPKIKKAGEDKDKKKEKELTEELQHCNEELQRCKTELSKIN